MSATTPTEVTQTQAENMLNRFTGQNIMDTMLSTYSASQLMTWINSNKKLSMANIGRLLFIASLNEIKHLIIYLTKEMKTWIVTLVPNVKLHLIFLITKVYSMMRRSKMITQNSKYFDNISTPIYERIEERVKNRITIDVDMNFQILASFIKLTDVGQKLYSKFYLKYDNLKEFTERYDLNGIVVQNDDIMISIDDTLNLEYKIDSSPHLIGFKQSENNKSSISLNPMDATSFIEFIKNTKIRNILKEYIEYLYSFTKEHISSRIDLYVNYSNCQKYSRTENLKFFFEIVLAQIASCFPKINVHEGFTELGIMVTLATKSSQVLDVECSYIKRILTDFINNSKLSIPELGINVNISSKVIDKFKEKFKETLGYLSEYATISQGYTLVKYSKYPYTKEATIRDYHKDIQALIDQKPEAQEKTLTVTISSDNKYTNQELYDKYKIFMSKLMTECQSTRTEELNIYILKVDWDITKQKIKNPEYIKYMKRREMIEGLIKTNASDDVPPDSQDSSPPQMAQRKTNRNLSPFINQFRSLINTQIPDEEIEIEVKTPKITKKCINKFSKPIDTLYLREADRKRLITILDAYKNKSHIFKDLGIPKKLGFMLHGKPGTGKTTAIKAIASYLGIDIFYIDLAGVTKNSELRMLFDHVSKNNGGILVMEDIDCMTDIVLKRSKDAPEFMTNMLDLNDDNDKITLSYLLNLLDGTLCGDDTVFAITTNFKNKLEPALYRPGRIDIDIQFKPCDHYQIKTIFKRIIDRDIDPSVLANIEENKHTPAEIIFDIIPHVFDATSEDKIIMKNFLRKSRSGSITEKDTRNDDKYNE